MRHYKHLRSNSYLKKLSPRNLKVEGSSTDQQPSEIFSPACGTNNPARGRIKYLLEEPAIRNLISIVLLFLDTSVQWKQKMNTSEENLHISVVCSPSKDCLLKESLTTADFFFWPRGLATANGWTLLA